MLNKLSIFKSKRSQVAATITWIVAFIIIFFIMFLFLITTTSLKGIRNNAISFSTISGDRIFMHDILSNFLESQIIFDGKKISIFDGFNYAKRKKSEIEQSLVDTAKITLNKSFPETRYSSISFLGANNIVYNTRGFYDCSGDGVFETQIRFGLDAFWLCGRIKE